MIKVFILLLIMSFVFTACGNRSNQTQSEQTILELETSMQAVNYKTIPFNTITGEASSLADFSDDCQSIGLRR